MQTFVLDMQKYSRQVTKSGTVAAVPEEVVRPVPEESLGAMVAILDLVRHGRAHSRAEIIRQTGLSRAIVTQRQAGRPVVALPPELPISENTSRATTKVASLSSASLSKLW